MAQAACDVLIGQGHRVIGISRNGIERYSERFMVDEYTSEELPESMNLLTVLFISPEQSILSHFIAISTKR